MLTDEQIDKALGLEKGFLAAHIDARAIEAAVLAQLREGAVELPEPYLREFTTGEMIKHFSEWQLLDYGDRRAAEATEREKERCANLAANTHPSD